MFISLQSDWFGHSLYDVVHPDDTEKLREQLSTSESQNTGRILDLKSKSSILSTVNIVNLLDIYNASHVLRY